MVKNPSVNAGDTGLIPGTGRSHTLQSNQAHAPQLLSLHSRAWEPQLLKPACPRAHAPTREATAMRSTCTATKSSPCSPKLEKSPHSNEDPTQPKINDN